METEIEWERGEDLYGRRKFISDFFNIISTKNRIVYNSFGLWTYFTVSIITCLNIWCTGFFNLSWYAVSYEDIF